MTYHHTPPNTIKQIHRIVHRLPIPTFGKWTRSVVTVWLVIMLVTVNMVYAVILRALVLNPPTAPVRISSLLHDVFWTGEE